jgi:hypothetical protein
VFPDKVGRPVTDRCCQNCLRAVPPVEWRGVQLTGEERTTAGRSGGAQRRYRVKCTNCGYEWWSTSPAVKRVANETEPIRGAPIPKRSVDELSMPKAMTVDEIVAKAKREGRPVVNASDDWQVVK